MKSSYLVNCKVKGRGQCKRKSRSSKAVDCQMSNLINATIVSLLGKVCSKPCVFKLFSLANITILANDGASGIVSFKSQDIVRIEESPGQNLTLNVAQLEVIRGPGIYGIVNVPFRIIPEKSENSADLTPTQGVVTFQDRQVIIGVHDNFMWLKMCFNLWVEQKFKHWIIVYRVRFSWSWLL